MEATETSKVDSLAKELARGQTSFFAKPFSFSWWVHGGEPGSPSYYFSIELKDRQPMPMATYIHTGMDFNRMPPEHRETFSAPISTARAAKILHALFEGPLFRESLPEESDRDMRDLQQETWKFTRGDTDLSKTLYEPFPATLDPVRVRCRELSDELAAAAKAASRQPGK